MSALVMASVLPAAIAVAVIATLRGRNWTQHLADHPNARSLHREPTPRLGGLGIAAGVAPFAAMASGPALGTIALCALFLFAVSLADDFRGLPIEVRLPAHLTAAGVVVLSLAGPAASMGWASAILAVLAIAWATNLYNFMDGADGLAGGMGCIGFAALAIAAERAGQRDLAVACVATASACVGFLAHNFPPARVFMGDCGAIPLGFLAGAIGVAGTVSGAWPAWFAPLVFSPFAVDATATLARRTARREKFWVAHRDHYYQRLVLAGWSKRRLALAEWALMILAAGSALLALEAGVKERWAIIFVWLAAYATLILAVGRLTRRKALAARVVNEPTSRMPE